MVTLARHIHFNFLYRIWSYKTEANVVCQIQYHIAYLVYEWRKKENFPNQ